MPITHLLLVLLIVVVWGFNFVMIKIGLEGMSPLFLCAIRFLVSCFPAILFIKRPAAPFKLILAYGLIIFVLQFACLFVGMSVGMSPGLASLVLQTHVFFTILLAVLFLGEVPNRWQVIGALIAFIGIGIVGFNLNADITPIGLILILGAALSWGIGNFISKKIGKVNIASLVVWGSFVALPPFCLMTLIFDGPASIVSTIQHFNWMSTLSVLYIVFASTWFGYGAWNWLLSRYPVATIVPFALLVPVCGMMFSTLVLGEPLESWKLKAAFFVIFGLTINMLGQKLLGKKKPAEESLAEALEIAE